MHELIEKVKCLEEKAVNIMSCEKFCLDSPDGAEMADEIKDYADALKNLYKAEYYKSAVKAMKESEQEPRWGEKAGYDNWRYASTGEFAPKGHGTRYGYMPLDNIEPPYLRSGYSMSQQGGSKYGESYDRYQDARRHYHETKDPSAKMDMDNTSMEYVGHAIHTFRDMWKDADPAMKKKMKMDLSNLIGEMTV